MLGAPAIADPVAALNRARATGCGHGGYREPLRESPTLDAAAQRMARGYTLHETLARLPERPTFAASMHFAGSLSDAEIAHAAAARFCRDLSNADLRDIGYAWRDRNLWVLVTAPLNVPSPRDRDAVETEVLRHVNAARARGERCGAARYPPAPPLRLSPTLSRVARMRSEEMAAADRLEHEGHDGSSPADRVRRAGYAARVVGENIADGVPTAREVVAGWLESPGHCTNIMDPRFTEMGIAYATNARSRGAIFWTQLLAEPR